MMCGRRFPVLHPLEVLTALADARARRGMGSGELWVVGPVLIPRRHPVITSWHIPVADRNPSEHVRISGTDMLRRWHSLSAFGRRRREA